MRTINYLHTKDIYYGDVKLENFLVFRNQSIKVGDLGISIKINSKLNDENDRPLYYRPRGYTRNYALEYISNFNNRVARPELLKNDRYGLWKSFHLIYEQMINYENGKRDKILESMLSDLHCDKNKPLNDIVSKWTVKLSQNYDFIFKLCD